MVEKTVVLRNATGLHARPAQRFTQEAAAFKAAISVAKAGANSAEVDAKSVLSILTLGCLQGDQIVIRADGEDAEEALTHLARLVEEGIGEEAAD